MSLFRFNYNVSELVCLGFFLLSTPAAAYFTYVQGYPKETAAIYNSYAFSLGYLFLWLLPLVAGAGAWKERVNRATSHWIIWMSCFTQLSFQIPHNLATPFLYRNKGDVRVVLDSLTPPLSLERRPMGKVTLS